MLSESDRELLHRFHADQIEHSGGSLLAHLAGTAALLESWGAPAALCRAGQFHSLYGTEALRQAAASLADAAPRRCTPAWCSTSSAPAPAAPPGATSTAR
jgi:hypothetical protein